MSPCLRLMVRSKAPPSQSGEGVMQRREHGGAWISSAHFLPPSASVHQSRGSQPHPRVTPSDFMVLTGSPSNTRAAVSWPPVDTGDLYFKTLSCDLKSHPHALCYIILFISIVCRVVRLI